MGINVMGIPKAVRGDEGEGDDGKKIGESVVMSVVLETNSTYTSVE